MIGLGALPYDTIRLGGWLFFWQDKKGKLLKYLALAKWATTGQLNHFIYSQSIILFKKIQWAAQIKTSNPQAARKYFIFLRAAQNNIPWFSHRTKLANLRLNNTLFQKSIKFLIFCRGSHVLSYPWCYGSPGFSSITDIPEQHKIKHIFTSSKKLNILNLSGHNNNMQFSKLGIIVHKNTPYVLILCCPETLLFYIMGCS